MENLMQMTDDEKILHYFHTMDEYERQHYLESMKWSAEQFAQREQVKLRLVADNSRGDLAR